MKWLKWHKLIPSYSSGGQRSYNGGVGRLISFWRECISLPFPLSRDHFSPWLVVPIFETNNLSSSNLSFIFASIHISLPTLTSLPPSYGLCDDIASNWSKTSPSQGPNLVSSVKSIIPCKVIDSLVRDDTFLHIEVWEVILAYTWVNLSFILTITVC